MNNKFFITGMAILCSSLFNSCKKTNDEIIIPPVDQSTATPVGTQVGTATHKLIDEKGGQLSSSDGTLQIIISTDCPRRLVTNERVGTPAFEGTSLMLMNFS